ncbi:MAG: NAD(P)/FAD-dependent oxidoreductase [Microbacteriaceae bacterium]|jgi:NADPH-dependent 2,4-dienoyl-CoA reductase/sulfur reductase-like enzyme
MSQRVLVVGAGLGGLRSAEALRAQGYHDEIVVVGDEPHAPYNRPPLSKEALADEVAHERLAFRQKASVEDVVWRLGQRVDALDLEARSAVVSGEQLDWDALVVATGVSARRLPVAGPPPSHAAGRHVVRTLDDALALRAALSPSTRLVVIGAGFIGCEVAATARTLGCEVDVVAVDDYPMQRPLGPMLGAELQRRHEGRGVRFHLGVGVESLLGDGHVTGVVLSDGAELKADVVVEALGSQCNVDLLDGQGLDLSDGVLADDALRPLRHGVPVDGVAAVGDVARFPNPRFDDRAFRVEHWSLPTDTGRRAGEVLAAFLRHGPSEAYDAVASRPWEVLPSFWSDQFDIRMQSFGMPGLADPDGVQLLEGDLAGECVVGYHRGGDLMGVVGLGMVRELMAHRASLGRSAR